MLHKLKINDCLEGLLTSRQKTIFRRNDKNYQLGDVLRFYDGKTDENIDFQITHLHADLGTHFVCLSVEFLGIVLSKRKTNV